MEEKKSPASAAESAASGQPAAVPAAELRPGRRKFPTVGDLFAMLGIAFGAQIVVGTAAMVFLLFAGHGLDFKSLEPAALGKVMAALYFCSMSITLAGILCYRRARGGQRSVGAFLGPGAESRAVAVGLRADVRRRRGARTAVAADARTVARSGPRILDHPFAGDLRSDLRGADLPRRRAGVAARQVRRDDRLARLVALLRRAPRPARAR